MTSGKCRSSVARKSFIGPLVAHGALVWALAYPCRHGRVDADGRRIIRPGIRLVRGRGFPARRRAFLVQ